MKKGHLYTIGSIIIILVIASLVFVGANRNNSEKEKTVKNVPVSQSPTPSPEVTNEEIEAQEGSGSALPSPTTMTNISKPEMLINKDKSYKAVLSTDKGEITVSLNAMDTPITVNNFVYLSRNNFYNGTVFHRTISGFMIQGGDPRGDGTGGPGYKFDDEEFSGEYKRGTIAMANSGRNTNGSQFFIMHKDYALPKNYVIFGQVSKGIEVVDAIATAPVTTSISGENSKPVTPVKVNKITIIEE